ncbi:uncharacterized protein LOC141648672 [Silene latifolia]|uniref:uncharacterized protein LOC141648672 n=1 Tax=Silene latifolia TaxID=37657 RepID=UPI003D789092
MKTVNYAQPRYTLPSPASGSRFQATIAYPDATTIAPHKPPPPCYPSSSLISSFISLYIERHLYSLGVKISKLRDSVKSKRIEYELLKQMETLSTVLDAQDDLYLESYISIIGVDFVEQEGKTIKLQIVRFSSICIL